MPATLGYGVPEPRVSHAAEASTCRTGYDCSNVPVRPGQRRGRRFPGVDLSPLSSRGPGIRHFSDAPQHLPRARRWLRSIVRRRRRWLAGTPPSPQALEGRASSSAAESSRGSAAAAIARAGLAPEHVAVEGSVAAGASERCRTLHRRGGSHGARRRASPWVAAAASFGADRSPSTLSEERWEVSRGKGG
jgi:hypothetical protein